MRVEMNANEVNKEEELDRLCLKFRDDVQNASRMKGGATTLSEWLLREAAPLIDRVRTSNMSRSSFAWPFVYLSQGQMMLTKAGSQQIRENHLHEVIRATTEGNQVFQELLDSASKEEGRLLRSFLAHNLYLRGRARLALRDNESAVVDLRSAAAERRRLGIELHDPKLTDNLEHLALALAHTVTDKPRPHYTPKERDRLFRELRLKRYSPTMLKCAQCGTSGNPSSEKKPLKSCSRCYAWFCSEKCMALDSHILACARLQASELFSPILLQDKLRTRVYKNISKYGFMTIVLPKTGPAIIFPCHDPSISDDGSQNNNSALFESITDKPCGFVSDYRRMSYEGLQDSVDDEEEYNCNLNDDDETTIRTSSLGSFSRRSY